MTLPPGVRRRLAQQLLIDEGVRLKPYRDTVGKLTIGCGRNLDDRGITADEAMYLLENDITDTWRALVKRFPWVTRLDEVRQAILLNMSFNMGIDGLATFVRTLAAVERGDYKAASEGMLRSLWASQVGQRAVRLAKQMEMGA